MSFGGRGGGGGFQRNLPFGLDYSDLNNGNKENEKPQIPLPVNGNSSKLEKIVASHFLNFQTTVKDGPFYTGSNLEIENTKGKTEIDEEGINDGLKRYSDRYRKKRKIGRSIDEHPYVIEFFPQELYKVMGVDDKKKKKLLSLAKLKNSKEVLDNLDNPAIGESILEKLKDMAEDEDDKEEPDPEPEENFDDEFESDDDDDYNAEKYFEDGDDFAEEDDFNDEAAF
ncbi:DNA-directed RNA polymerase III subunit [Wickerhamomyces ciferrii]|uniref:DNA-directed RNA polymerase III subunit n=1 Tax=Wickerhamomyces ciferrii (strain ATCC 14091 / BCRC 22168 / CBS 111 / JCM 3599 / NBRC 0793 / NRRL Y-1031 F-60-10) TaxID=1206466 RepID=K0KQN0_WICCF|nr:DNA-directed RNA polymerase III subunit [Wickerhamomyces ciferrii]CCH43573.1 DNA-directed RNA polymerase III subunit [Wickerhamomyces ciferrii]